MSLAASLAKLKERGELAFMPYQTAGYPSLDESLANLHKLAEIGADVLELGVPFSDPVADGPTIQFSSQEALKNGISLRGTLAKLKTTEFAAPLVLMSYINPLLTFERDALFAELKAAHVSGLIVPDLAIEEADEWLAAGRKHGVSLIFLLAPTSSDRRIREVAERSDAFIYAVAVTGTTGSREKLYEGLPAFLERIRAVSDAPVIVGFGISRPEHVQELRGKADGVVVASRIIDAIRNNQDWTSLARLLKDATRP